jgi:vacuolar protein sorting-associated protein VTA1
MGDAAKSLIPYLQRADEMQKHDPRVAYYCALIALCRLRPRR